MWNKTPSLIVAAATLLAAAPAARADKIDTLMSQMYDYIILADNDSWDVYKLEHAKKPAECRADIAAAKKAGAKDTDTGEISPDRKRVLVPENLPKGYHSGTYMIAVGDLGPICDAYEKAYEAGTLSATVLAAFELEEWMTLIKPEQGGSSTGMSTKPQACLDVIDARIKSGVAGSTVFKVEGKDITIDDARASCERILASAKEFEAAVAAREKADTATALEPYQKVGIKGARLELFASYHPMEWYLPGCTSSTGDPKKLKKAKKLFHWLTDSNGVITIRKYTFKGDKYKTSEKTYYSEAKAYKGCR